jgi:hypothetical protein
MFHWQISLSCVSVRIIYGAAVGQVDGRKLFFFFLSSLFPPVQLWVVGGERGRSQVGLSPGVCHSNEGVFVTRHGPSYVQYIERLINSHHLKMNNYSPPLMACLSELQKTTLAWLGQNCDLNQSMRKLGWANATKLGASLCR